MCRLNLKESSNLTWLRGIHHKHWLYGEGIQFLTLFGSLYFQVFGFLREDRELWINFYDMEMMKIVEDMKYALVLKFSIRQPRSKY